MQQKKSAGVFLNGMQSTLKDMMDAVPTSSPFDLKTMMDLQRKNFQAMTEANQIAMTGWQALARKQAEMFTQMVQDNALIARAALCENTPDGQIAKQGEAMKSSYEKAMANNREMTRMMTECTQEAARLIGDRIAATMSELKACTKQSQD